DQGHFTQRVNRFAAHLVAARDFVKADEGHAEKSKKINGPEKPISDCPLPIADGEGRGWSVANGQWAIGNWKSFLFLLLLRLAAFDSFPILQIAADGLVATGNDFLTFLESLGDF